jgi:exodeoxyribonuclease VII large subunit
MSSKRDRIPAQLELGTQINPGTAGGARAESEEAKSLPEPDNDAPATQPEGQRATPERPKRAKPDSDAPGAQPERQRAKPERPKRAKPDTDAPTGTDVAPTPAGDTRAELEEEQPRLFRVSQIIRLVSRQLEQHFRDVWVEGEVSNLRRPASGHAYFTLKDDQAQLSAVLFRSTLIRLGFELKDGQQLRCRGNLGIYERQGRFQMTVLHAQPAGIGALQAAFERLKRKLAAEGLFEPARKQALPPFPRHIAVVTSRTGAALRDILRVLEARFPVRVTVCHAAVQGDVAPDEICEALKRADACGADVIIAGRGGGSLEDLWAFNTEAVARTIFTLKTPVISAVGHEIDFVISDFVADLRAPTPSAAAEMAVPDLDDIEQRLRVLAGRLERGAHQHIRRAELRLERLRARLGTPARLVDQNRMKVDELSGRNEQRMRRALQDGRARLSGLRLRLSANQPSKRLERKRTELQRLEGRLNGAIQAQIGRQRRVLARAAATLNALSPLAVLGRGYSLALTDDGMVIRDASTVRLGQSISLRLHRGKLLCSVQGIEPTTEA